MYIVMGGWPSVTDDDHTQNQAHILSQQMLNNTANGKSMRRNNVSKQRYIVLTDAWFALVGHMHTRTLSHSLVGISCIS